MKMILDLALYGVTGLFVGLNLTVIYAMLKAVLANKGAQEDEEWL